MSATQSSGTEASLQAKPVTIVVPQTAGSVADKLTRALAQSLSDVLAQSVLVENRPGSQGLVGSEYVALEAPADGHTILMTSLNNISSFSTLGKDGNFNPLRDLTPIMGFCESRLVLGTPPLSPWRSFEELIAHARAHPGTLRYGASSSSNQITTALLLQLRDAVAVYSPFDATRAYQELIVSGETHMGLMPESTSLAWGDKIRFLAQTGDGRCAGFPDIPTFAELGLPQIGGVLYTLNVRSGTPANVIDRLNRAVRQAMQRPDTIAEFEKLHLHGVQQTPEFAQENLRTHARMLSDMARKLGVSPE